jgi:hypothetical protein
VHRIFLSANEIALIRRWRKNAAGHNRSGGTVMLQRIRIHCVGVWIHVRLYCTSIYVLSCSWTVRVLISCLRKVRLAPDRSECNCCLSYGVSVYIFLLHVVSKYLNKSGFLFLQNVFSSFIIWQRVAHSSEASSMTSKIRRIYVILKLKVYTD